MRGNVRQADCDSDVSRIAWIERVAWIEDHLVERAMTLIAVRSTSHPWRCGASWSSDLRRIVRSRAHEPAAQHRAR